MFSASGQAVPEHTHQVEEVLLVTTAECIITVAGRPEAARTGDAVVIAPGTRHAIHHDGDEPCEVTGRPGCCRCRTAT
jgi:quercetin dioxygenase-like cupin family protein